MLWQRCELYLGRRTGKRLQLRVSVKDTKTRGKGCQLGKRSSCRETLDLLKLPLSITYSRAFLMGHRPQVCLARHSNASRIPPQNQCLIISFANSDGLRTKLPF